MGCPNTALAMRRPAPDGDGADDVGGLVMGAADGDDRAWRELVGHFSPLVQDIVLAHRLSAEEAVEVNNVVWMRLDREIGRLRQPDHVGTWLAAVTRHECVRKLTAQD